MAKVIASDADSRLRSESFNWFKVLVIGAVLGAVHRLMTILIDFYIGSVTNAGDIATILTATVGLLVMVRFKMTRPLIVAIATAISLWGLSSWTHGLDTVEIIVWSVVLYALAYFSFSWVVRFSRLIPVLLVVMMIMIIIRIISY